MRTCMLKLERVRSSSVFSVSCRLQLKVLCIFYQGNAVFEVLIGNIKVQSRLIKHTGLARLKAIASVSILSL